MKDKKHTHLVFFTPTRKWPDPAPLIPQPDTKSYSWGEAEKKADVLNRENMGDGKYIVKRISI